MMSTTATVQGTNGQVRLRGLTLAAVLTGLMLTLFLEALDQTIVGAAMPRIIAELHGLDRYSWVVTAYILASMTMIPIVGKLSDQFGRKWFLVGGTAIFLLGSMLAGAAQSMDQLIVFRGVQGLGAGIGMALIATVMADLFPPEERAKWTGLYGAVYGISSLLGPTLGGWLTEHGPLVGSFVSDAGRWRWAFYINLPVGLVALCAVLACLPARMSAGQWAGVASLRRIDIAGAALCAAGTVCLILGLTWGGAQSGAWGAPAVLAMLVVGILLLGLFMLAERRAREPILPLALFANPVFSVGALLTLLQSMVLLGLSLYLPLFFQGVLGVSPTGAGLTMTPFSLSMVAGAMLGGAAISRLQRYRAVGVTAALLICVGTLLIAGMSSATSLPLAIGFMVITGVGTGAFFTLPTVAVQNSLPVDQLGAGTASVRYLGQVGATLGIAIVGAAVASGVSGDLMQQFPAGVEGQAALAGALQRGFLAAFVFAVLTLVTALFLQDRRIAADQAAGAAGQPGEPASMAFGEL
jgi:EmrB/QacA subfamily drug resistance transporter